MAGNDEPDFFQDETQGELFDENAAPTAHVCGPDRVRARLYRILAETRAAKTLPWGSARVSLYHTIFPQMTNWLTGEEGAQLRFEFAEELERLVAA